MGLYILKFPYRKVLLPLARKLKWIHPDIISYAAVAVALVTGLCYYYAGRYPALLLWAIAAIFLRMTLNTIDGVMAIERGNLSLKGEIVNALPDRYSDIFLLLGISFSSLCNTAVGVLALVSVFLVSYTGMLGKALGVNWQHHGPLGKVERLIYLMVWTLIQYVNQGANLSLFGFSYTALEWCMWLFIILGQVTVFNRLRGMLEQIIPLEWIQKGQSRYIGKKTLVVYDSHSGNTKVVAEKIAESLAAAVSPVDEAETLDSYDLVVLCTPNIRARPTAKLESFIGKNKDKINRYALCVTYGAPVWGALSLRLLRNYTERLIGSKPIGFFACKGFHAKFKTYSGHPDDKDKAKAFLFGINLAKKLRG